LKINNLRIENLRNLASVSLRPHPRLNFIIGDNGAGKTSILESIVILSRGRSFRTIQATELVGPEQKTFRVFSETASDDGKTSRLGIERTGKHWKARKNGQDLAQISQLTRSLPLILMEPNSHLLVSGAPENRRKFLDWGLFHVEHTFLEIFARFTKALRQRNAAIRRQQIELLDSFDAALSGPAMQLSALRSHHVQSIERGLADMLARISPTLTEISLGFNNGWGEGDYLQALMDGRAQDIDRGVTRNGPHRADIILNTPLSMARNVLSRGEQKSLSAALLLIQAQQLGQLGEAPLILLDDLGSEFDEDHYKNVLSAALSCAGQVWVTGVRAPDWDEAHHVFHVEHGRVQEVV
jgi:DNA replication and repair protein RecF